MGFSQKIGSIFVEIFGDKSKLDQTLKEVRAESEKTGKQIEQNVSQAKKGFDLTGLSVEQLKLKLKDAKAEVVSLTRQYETWNSLGKIPDVINNLELTSKKLSEAKAKVIELETQIKNLNASTKQTSVEMDGAAKSGMRFGDYVVSSFERIAVRLAAYYALFKAFNFIAESVKASAEIEGVRKKFDELNNPGILDKLRQATRGAVSDLQLMETATKAASFGISGDLLAKGLEFAGKQARQTGQDVNYLVDSFVMGIGMKSTRRLDNLQIKLQDIQTEVRKTGGNFEQAIGNIIDQRLKEMGNVSETAADKFAQFQTKIENLKVAVGDELIPALEPLLTIFEKDIDGAERFGVSSSTLGGIIRTLAAAIALMETNLNAVGIALGTVGATIAKTLQVLYTYSKAAFEIMNGNYLAAMNTIETGAKIADIWDIATKGIKMYVGNFQNGVNTMKQIATNPSLDNLAHKFTGGKPDNNIKNQPLLSTAVSDEMEGLKTQTDLMKTNYLLGEATKKQYIDALKNEKDELENLKEKTLLTSDYAKVQARILAVAQELSSKGTKEVKDLQKEVDNFYKSLSLNDNNVYQNALNNLKKQRDEYLKTIKDKSEVDKWYNEEFAKLQSDRAKAHDDELNKTLNAITLTQEYYDLTDTNDKVKIQNAIDYIDKLEKESKTSEFLNELLKERKELEDKLRKAGTPIVRGYEETSIDFGKGDIVKIKNPGVGDLIPFNPTMSEVGGVPKTNKPGLSQDEEENLLMDKLKKEYGEVGRIVESSMRSVENSFASNMSRVLTGQENFANAIKNIWMGILTSIIETVAKILIQYAMIGFVKAALAAPTGGASLAIPTPNMVGSPTVTPPSIGGSPILEKGLGAINNSIQAMNMNMMSKSSGSQIIVQTSDPSTKVIEKYIGVQNRMALNGTNLSDFVNGK